jgi:4'-phosphopantetheinyl transferase
MPLLIYQSNHNNTGRLLVWKAKETLEELSLLYRMSTEEEQDFKKIKLEKRKREWLVARILLKIVAPTAELYFAPTGKPMLRDGRWISISHCGELAGLVICEHPVGLDIQGTDEKLEKIAGKFCNTRELEKIKGEKYYLEYLTIIWSVKEAVFKFFGEHVQFNEDIIVHPFHYHQEELKADYRGVHGRMTFELQHVQLRGYHIVMTV